MRIAIVSPGGVGGYFGGLLASAGHSVTALARGEHLAAIRESGLRVEGPRGNFTVQMEASDNASQFGITDVVLFAVKLFQAEAAAKAAMPFFGPRTIGISLMNGMEGPDLLLRALPKATILGGSAYVSAVVDSPGCIRYIGDLSSIAVANPPTGSLAQSRIIEFRECCERAGFAVRLSDDVRGILWSKLVGLSTNSALTAASRLPCGDLYADADIVEVAIALLAEATAIARAQGVQLPSGIETEWLDRLKNFPPDLYASMYHDLIKGRELEIDGLSGYIVREGKRLGVPTPHHAALYAILKPHRHGNRGA